MSCHLWFHTWSTWSKPYYISVDAHYSRLVQCKTCDTCGKVKRRSVNVP